ncbi:hypothetical protein PFBG_04608 [Plasmodium falciparum 7G8]|uniref:Uncharacterized protein n=1 Tax=Plasmodium falciparum (isolate 7G8) TaxID=57266 RepID=W7F9Z5_PLAF8|nr:hypothetical protein PFBG_04608 [Plasmodium falciparum 7G8]
MIHLLMLKIHHIKKGRRYVTGVIIIVIEYLCHVI